MPDVYRRDRRIRTAVAVAAVARLVHDRSAPPIQAHRVQTSEISRIAFSLLFLGAFALRTLDQAPDSGIRIRRTFRRTGSAGTI